MAYDKADLNRRLAGGEWLQVGAIAALAGVSRNTVNAWLYAGKITMRHTTTLGGHRRFHPDDVRALLADVGEIRGVAHQPAEPDPLA